MTRRAAVAAVVLAVSQMQAIPAGAAKLVALVAGSTSETVIGDTAVRARLDDMMGRLFAQGEGDHIVQALDVGKAELEQRIGEFESRLKDADFALVYYIGRSAHDDGSGTTYLVPREGGRNAKDLVALTPLIERMRTDAGGKALIVIDAVEDPAAWISGSVRSGIGSLDGQTGGRKVVIASSSVLTGSGQEYALLAQSLGQRLKGSVSARQLAALVQEDVGYGTGGAVVPRVSGTIETTVRLEPPGTDDEARDDKIKRCTVANQRSGVDVGAEPSEGSEVLSARSGTKSRSASRLFPFFCPIFAALTPPETPKAAPKRKARQDEEDDKPKPSTKRKEPEERPQARKDPEPSAGSHPGGGGGGGGGGGKRWQGKAFRKGFRM